MSPTTVEMLVQGARRGTRSAPRHDALPLSVDRMASLRQPLPTLSNRGAGVDEATERRAAVLDRHRREAHGPRQQIYQAIQTGDIEKAKLAKITAETLRIVQELERKSWGFDAAENAGGAVIVIDRG